MRINTNMASLIAWRHTAENDNAVSKSLERLSSGLRINRAADDVAGLAITERMRSQINGLSQAVKNAQDGTSLARTTEGSLSEVHTLLQRMRELAVQSANGTLQAEDRSALQTELDQITMEITRLTGNTEFNGVQLLDGSLQASGTGELSLQIGPNSGQVVTMGVAAMDAASLGIARDVLTGTVDNGAAAELAATTRVARQVLDIGEGIGNGKFQVRYSAPPSEVQLLNAQGIAIGRAEAVPATGNTIVTLGDQATGKTLTLELNGPLTPGDVDILAIQPRPQAVGTVQNAGPGLTAGAYTVNYDASARTLQLKDSLGNAIGVPVAVKPGETVQLGDKNSARTLQVALKQPLPTTDNVDHINLGSPVGRVKANPPGPSQILAASNGVGGTMGGLFAGTYRVHYDTATDQVQLQDNLGNNIGGPQAFNPGDYLTLGDAATGRAVYIHLDTERPTGNGYATVQVTATPSLDVFNGPFVGPNVGPTTGTIADRIIGVGTGVTNGTFQLIYDHTAGTVQLATASGYVSPPAVYDPNAMSITVGNPGTGEWVQFVPAVPAPGADAIDSATVSGAANVVEMVLGTGGAFLTDSEYHIQYTAATVSFQLVDSGGNLIGPASMPTPGSRLMTVGDILSGEYVSFMLPVNLPAGDRDDTLIKNYTRVTGNPAASSTQVLPSDGTAIQSVGANLDSGIYRVAYDKTANTFQLQDLKGVPIGQARTADPLTHQVTLGDTASGRSLTVTVSNPIDASGYSTVEITNNDGKAQAASFAGGARVNGPRAQAGLNISSADAARAAISQIDAAITTVSDQRSQLGALENRLDHTMANLEVVAENLTGAESRIRDVDMAQEMANFTKRQILVQSTAAMLTQANQKQQIVLQLLKP